MNKVECLMQYIDYVDSQIEAGLMPSKFVVWFEHLEIDDNEEYAAWRRRCFDDAGTTRALVEG